MSKFDLTDYPILSGVTLDEALDFNGGNTLEEKAQILLRNAVAAVLNAAHPNIDYPLTIAEVIDEVNTALDNAYDTNDHTYLTVLESVLDGYNNLGGDLGS